MGLYDKHDRLIQVICSAYLPFFDGDKTRLAQYIETIDALQSIIDIFAGVAPFKILGDFNTQLPMSKKLSKNWHRGKGFTIYSSILYDFLVHNNLTSADLHFKQNPRYTFFCHTSSKYTWIDHIFCNMNDLNQVNACSIVPEDSENVSDHLPVRIDFSLLLEKNYQQHINRSQLVQPKWSNALRNERYLQISSEKLSQIGKLSIPASGLQDIKESINERFES